MEMRMMEMEMMMEMMMMEMRMMEMRIMEMTMQGRVIKFALQRPHPQGLCGCRMSQLEDERSARGGLWRSQGGERADRGSATSLVSSSALFHVSDSSALRCSSLLLLSSPTSTPSLLRRLSSQSHTGLPPSPSSPSRLLPPSSLSSKHDDPPGERLSSALGSSSLF
eukprot:407815-Hanusia_phi.AAC.1